MSADDYQALCAAARKALKRGEVLQAIEFYEDAVSLDPDEVDAHEGLATASYMAQDYPTAMRAFVRVTQLKPRDAKAFVNLGAICNLTKDYSAAADWLRKGIQRDGRNVDCYYNLGIAQKNLGQLPLALSAYRECLRLDPRMIDAHINMANVLVEQGNYKKALEHYSAALAVDVGCDRAQRGLDHVRHVMQQGKTPINPFGRLVDTEALDRKNSEQAAVRTLSSDERFEDRQLIQFCTADAVEAGELLLRLLADRLEPALLQANRCIAEGGVHRSRLLAARDQFQKARLKAEKLFLEWQSQYHRLRDHESVMQAPVEKAQ